MSKDKDGVAARNRKEEEVEHLLFIRTRLYCGVVHHQEVPIGGPSTTGRSNSNVETFRGARITVKDKDKNTLSIYNGKASVHKDSGKIDASGARITVKDKDKNTLSVYNSEADINLSANEAIISGCALLTADSEQETVTAFNADLIADEETALLESDHIELTYNDHSIGVTASGGKDEGDTKAKLDVDKNVISFDGKSIVVECGDDTKISAEHANMCINRDEGKLYLEGSDANFRAGVVARFIPKVKNACVDLATGNIYCNGEFVCCAPLLGGQLRKLFKVGPKPASTLASSLLTSY